jgi:mannose-6-phosphate isomerase-like protein (cupin superfamily)
MSAALEHCVTAGPIAQGSHDGATLSGETFDVALREYIQGEISTGGLDGLGEEVATILSGSFDVDAAGEHYSLSPGEGIIIPPGEPRQWTCTSGTGLLYRAVTRAVPSEQVQA